MHHDIRCIMAADEPDVTFLPDTIGDDEDVVDEIPELWVEALHGHVTLL
jgi:hypothetical protein